jgi:hypothetical protein
MIARALDNPPDALRQRGLSWISGEYGATA